MAPHKTHRVKKVWTKGEVLDDAMKYQSRSAWKKATNGKVSHFEWVA